MTLVPTNSPRTCGSCKLCCKLVPVEEIEKPRMEWCSHINVQGCSIYPNRPTSCHVWSCAWLSQTLGEFKTNIPEDLAPRLVHAVIDTHFEISTATDNDTGATSELTCVQIWMDSGHEYAFRQGKLREFIFALSEHDLYSIIRLRRPEDSVLVAAGKLDPSGQGWYEFANNNIIQPPDQPIVRMMQEQARARGITHKPRRLK